jgi:hypothetical protein
MNTLRIAVQEKRYNMRTVVITDIAYHFTNNTLRDGRPVPAIGETLRHEGKLVICKRGLHWSRDPFDALRYAPGPYLHRVRVGGQIVEQDDKGASTERTILATIDATHLMRRFAADQALSVAHLWNMPQIVRDYLTTLDDTKRAAARAAAAEAAARAAAEAAAAWTAVDAAAWDPRDAALDAARAARYAVWDAARAAAARAARAAALDAARATARADFNSRVVRAFKEMTND